MKKISILFMVIVSFNISNVFGQEAGSCQGVTVTEVSSGPRLGAIFRVNRQSCGRGGFICVMPNESVGITEGISEKVFSSALAALSNGATVNVEWIDTFGCGTNIPLIGDLRVHD